MSRLVLTQYKKNIRKIFLFGLLTITLIIAFIFFGIPALGKIALFIADFNNKPTEVSDNTPPAPPQLDLLPKSTNKTNIEISGSTESGVSVILLFNSQKKGIRANSAGKFSYKYELTQGKNSLSAYAIDSSGNESQKTQEFEIFYDNTPPELTINKPENGKEFYGSKQKQVSIKGITETNIDLTVNDKPVSINENGEFVYTTILSEGENNFMFTAIDSAGNSTQKSIGLKFSP